jgi:RND family efflux transporter MFP subunit
MSEKVKYSQADHSTTSGRWAHRFKIVALIIVLLVGVVVMKYLKDNGPEADKELPPPLIPVVNVMGVRVDAEQLVISTQGRVESVRKTQAASEVMGRVVMVSPKFEVGGQFSHDEIMLEIDDADYVSALAAAESSLAEARLLLAQEQARADQAGRDWGKLGRGEASDLVLRKPQIESAQAHITAATAAVGKAKRDLERTKLRAPYDCRVEATYTDLGSYIMIGARLADLYSADAFEARVPVTLEELGYLDKDKIIGSKVIVNALLGGVDRQWHGSIVRNEGVVDQQTMTMYLVVGIKPQSEAGPYRLPPLGLFVQAEIQGGVMEGVIKVPRSALRPDNTLLTVNAANELELTPVTLARTLEKSVLVSAGLSDGAKVIVSPMETPVSGMKLSVQEQAEGDK